jgi:hypothetical protein
LADNFGEVLNYLGLVIPLGISAAASSLMCLVSAKEAGDPYPVRESLIADGVGTILSSFLGSPFGTVIYVRPQTPHSDESMFVCDCTSNNFVALMSFGVIYFMNADRPSCL